MITVAVVGIGYWGPNYLRTLTQLEEAQVSWVCDLNTTALSRISRMYPDVRTTTKLEDLVADRSLQAAIVVTPAQTHYEIVKPLLNSGKHVLVEKPITDDLRLADELIKLAAKNNATLMVDHTYLFNGGITKLKQLIDDNELGRIYYLYGMYNALGPLRRDVSAMWDLPHLIYVANYLLSSTPESVVAIGKDYLIDGMEDVVFLTLSYPNDVLVNLSCSWIDPVKIRRLVVVGSKQMAIFDDMLPDEKLKVYDRGVGEQADPNFAELQLIIRSGAVVSPKLDTTEPLRAVVNTFINAIASNELPMSTGREGWELVKVLTAAEKSLKANGKRIWLNKN